MKDGCSSRDDLKPSVRERTSKAAWFIALVSSIFEVRSIPLRYFLKFSYEGGGLTLEESALTAILEAALLVLI